METDLLANEQTSHQIGVKHKNKKTKTPLNSGYLILSDKAIFQSFNQ